MSRVNLIVTRLHDLIKFFPYVTISVVMSGLVKMSSLFQVIPKFCAANHLLSTGILNVMFRILRFFACFDLVSSM